VSDFYTSTPPFVIHDWLRQRIGLPWSSDFRALARVVDDHIIAVVGYEGFTGTCCRMHMAGEGPWITRDFIRRAFRYPFEVLDLAMVFGVVPSGNTLALDIDRRLGFKEVFFAEGAHPDGGLHFLRFTRDDWMRSKYYVKESTRPAKLAAAG
jgi:hypothetical protein